MNVLLRAVITGFGYSLGASLYKKIAQRFEDDEKADDSSKDAAPDHPIRPGGHATDDRPDASPPRHGDGDGDAPDDGDRAPAPVTKPVTTED